jgi:hypothetical protein
MISCVGIDPGTEQSAIVAWTGTRIGLKLFASNEDIMKVLRQRRDNPVINKWPLVIEMIHSQGMPVGAETFMTCVWIGRFMEAYDPTLVQLVRRDHIKNQICGTPRANDSNVRQALLDRFGGSKAIGLKKSPGPLYGISNHLWSALAAAIAYKEMKEP